MAIEETERFVWDYSQQTDILNIHKKGLKTSGSAELGDFTVDFDSAGNVIGVEIMNVAEFLQESDIPAEQLPLLQGVEMITKRGRDNLILIWIKLLLPQHIERKILLPAPVMVEAAE